MQTPPLALSFEIHSQRVSRIAFGGRNSGPLAKSWVISCHVSSLEEACDGTLALTFRLSASSGLGQRISVDLFFFSGDLTTWLLPSMPLCWPDDWTPKKRCAGCLKPMQKHDQMPQEVPQPMCMHPQSPRLLFSFSILRSRRIMHCPSLILSVAPQAECKCISPCCSVPYVRWESGNVFNSQSSLAQGARGAALAQLVVHTDGRDGADLWPPALGQCSKGPTQVA